jgi:hypothetical protein
MKRNTTTKKPAQKDKKLELIKEITKELTKVNGGCAMYCNGTVCCATRTQ